MVSATTVSISDRETQTGTTVAIPIVLDVAQQGLAGYVMNVSLSDPNVARIQNVTFPDWAGLNDAEIQQDSSVSLKAVDIHQDIGAGNERVVLATLLVSGITQGTLTIQPLIATLDDDNGFAMDASVIPGKLLVTGDEEETWQLHLYPGWNMVSIPVPLKPGENTAAIFSGIAVDGHSIFTFSPSAGWQTLNQYSVIQPTDAYWIYSELETTIPIYPGTSTGMQKQLTTGWNLIGIPGSDQVSVENILSGAPGWVYLISYEAEKQRYQDPITNDAQSGTSGILLEPGTGYWVFMNEDGILSGN